MSPTPAGAGIDGATNGFSLHQGHQGYAQPHPQNAYSQSYGVSTFDYPTANQQDRAPRAYQDHLPAGVYGPDDSYGRRPQEQPPQIYKSELPTPAPSDHNSGYDTKAIQSTAFNSHTEVKAVHEDDDDFGLDSQWMSEVDPKMLEVPTSSGCESEM